MSRRKNNSNKINFDLIDVKPLTEKQGIVLGSNKNLVLAGSAGTGKTFLASYLGFKAFLSGEYDQVLFIRSAVSTRNIGFLPGNEKEKMKVYKAPYQDICKTLFDRGDAFETLEQKGLVSFQPTSFVRGITFRRSFIIVDECQNMTFHELDSLITRLDSGSRIIFCGDIKQADLFKNGFGDFYRILRTMNEFEFVEFSLDDVVRGDLVKSYLRAKEDYKS